MKHADLPRTFGSGDVSEILPEMWGKLARGEHFEIKALDEDEGAIPFANVARQASAHREIHWKTAADWRAYIKEFGPHDPTSAVVHAFDVAARRVALLQHFGTKPREEFENDIGYLRAPSKAIRPSSMPSPARSRTCATSTIQLDYSTTSLPMRCGRARSRA